MNNILVSWIGHTDLRAMSGSCSTAVKKQIETLVGNSPTQLIGNGPVKTAVSQGSFQKYYFISNYPAPIEREFIKWLNFPAEAVHCNLEDPTDYSAVYKASEKALTMIIARHSQDELSLLLSPGTPAMAAILVLLGKTKYPATFYQTHMGRLKQTEVPFDITVDVIPSLYQNADRVLDSLARFSPKDVPGFEGITGESRTIKLAVSRAYRTALRDVTVLLTGESGTGKELFARAIHATSRRRDKPFVVVNCAAIPKDLLESELFGHVKGAFTGAAQNYEGAFRQAEGGILFLDEVGECSPEIQAKLLRAAQPVNGQHTCMREIYPVGSRKAFHVNVRIIAATNRDLLALAGNGGFRSDLYYRLAVITIDLPPLRERKGDAEQIANSLLARINQDFEKQEPGYMHKYLCDSANKFIKTYGWPGNVRELYNVLVQSAVMSLEDGLSNLDLQQCVRTVSCAENGKNLLDFSFSHDFSLDGLIEILQKKYILKALDEANGIKSKAARLLGISNYQTLDARMKKLNIKG